MFLIWRTRNIDLYDYEISEALDRELTWVQYHSQVNTFRRYKLTKKSPYDEIVSKACLQNFEKLSWAHESLSHLGFRDIQNLTGKPEKAILDTIEALGTSELNPIDLEIYHHIYNLYVKEQRSLEETAEILRLSINYIRNCLVKYKLPTHSSKLNQYDPNLLRLYRQIKYFSPDLVKLKHNGIVVTGPSNVHVLISNQIKKRQSTRYRIEENSGSYRWLPKIVPEYEDQDIERDYPHWTVQDKLKSSIERRVASVRLTRHILNSKDKKPKHPQDTINKCIDRLKNNSLTKADDFWKVVEHYFGNDELKYYIERPSQLFHIVTDAMNSDYVKYNSIVTSRVITEFLYRKRLRIGYMSQENIQRAFEDCAIVGPIYDPYPGVGCLALACARLGITYYYGSDDHIFNRGIENGFLDAIGGKNIKYDGSKTYYMVSQNLPCNWYPIFGKNCAIWGAVNGGNTYHLKLMMRNYDITKISQVGNQLKMVKFNPKVV